MVRTPLVEVAAVGAIACWCCRIVFAKPKSLPSRVNRPPVPVSVTAMPQSYQRDLNGIIRFRNDRRRPQPHSDPRNLKAILSSRRTLMTPCTTSPSPRRGPSYDWHESQAIGRLQSGAFPSEHSEYFVR